VAHAILSNAFKRAFLQDPQQLALQFERDLAHLAKEKRSFVSQLESSDSVAEGSRESTLHMTEELALEGFTNVHKIEWSDFEKVVMVAGPVLRVEEFPEARKPTYKIWIDFGPYGERRTSAQVTELYTPKDLTGRQIVAVINFPEKQVGPFRSQLLLTGFPTKDGVVITTVERPVPNGTRLA
jgi:tRNA-binding protein